MEVDGKHWIGLSSNASLRGGTHTGDAWRRTGYCGLGRAIDSLGLKTSKTLDINYVVGSRKTKRANVKRSDAVG